MGGLFLQQVLAHLNHGGKPEGHRQGPNAVVRQFLQNSGQIGEAW